MPNAVACTVQGRLSCARARGTVPFSKFVGFLLLHTAIAFVAAHASLDHSLHAYGSPADVFTDKGRDFVAEF